MCRWLFQEAQIKLYEFIMNQPEITVRTNYDCHSLRGQIHQHNVFSTRMHSSGMRTARLLTVSRSIHWGGGGVSKHALGRGWGCVSQPALGGGCLSGDVCPGGSLSRGGLSARGVSAQGVSASGPGCMCVCGRHPPPSGQTDTCENITFANFVCGR